jgi:hypothetical protein
MDTAWISAFSAVMGSLVGGFTTFVTTYANQRSQYRRDFLSKQFAKRETLYSEFINEAARLQIDSFDRRLALALSIEPPANAVSPSPFYSAARPARVSSEPSLRPLRMR